MSAAKTPADLALHRDRFAALCAAQALSPRSADLNQARFAIGLALQGVKARADSDGLEGPDPRPLRERIAAPRSPTEVAIVARGRLNLIRDRAGPCWPLLRRVLFEDAALDECRDLAPEELSVARADAALLERLRTGLDWPGSF